MRGYGKTLSAILAVVLVLAGLWFLNRPTPPRAAAGGDGLAEAAKGDYRLVTTREVEALRRERPGDLLLVDTRQDWEYRGGHFAGAVNFALEPTAWSRWWKAGELGELLGPDKNRPVVFY